MECGGRGGDCGEVIRASVAGAARRGIGLWYPAEKF
jgi:hypothetical protein